MSQKHAFILVSLLFFFFPAAEAQMAINFNQHMLIKISDKTLYGDPAKEKVEGTPYLNEQFITGVVYDDKQKYAGVPMRYNIYEDNIEFKQNNKDFILDAQPQIRKVELDGHTFVVDNYDVKGATKPGYFFLLDSGKVILMSKKVKTFRDQQPPKALEVGPTPAKFTDESEAFYFKAANSPLTRVSNIKNMIAGFPDKQAELTEFVKKEKISHKKEEDLIKLVKYYNSL
jgi:hypothetical protein